MRYHTLKIIKIYSTDGKTYWMISGKKKKVAHRTPYVIQPAGVCAPVGMRCVGRLKVFASTTMRGFPQGKGCGLSRSPAYCLHLHIHAWHKRETPKLLVK